MLPVKCNLNKCCLADDKMCYEISFTKLSKYMSLDIFLKITVDKMVFEIGASMFYNLM
jgi:hypothetical protein